ncbi:MAG: 8-amino-7-oxononanoate synthase, partial [Serratia inhibens]
MSWQQRIEQALEERQQNAAYRRRQVNQGGNGRHIQLNGDRYLNFSGNDYL